MSNVEIPACSIVTMPTRKAVKYTTSTLCIYEVQFFEIMVVLNPQLDMLPIVHLKSKVEPDQMPVTLINQSKDVIHLTKHVKVGSLKIYANYQDIHILKYISSLLNNRKTCYPVPHWMSNLCVPHQK